MEKDKKILIITSGVFMCVLAVMLFITLQAKDRMIESSGRRGLTEEVQLADPVTTCTDWASSGTTYVLNGSQSSCNGVPTRSNAAADAESACEFEGNMAPTTYACPESDSGDEICAIIHNYSRTCTTTVRCYQLQNDGKKCEGNVEVEGTSCTGTNIYPDAASCRTDLRCLQNNMYLNGNTCWSCPDTHHLTDSNNLCTGAQNTCCTPNVTLTISGPDSVAVGSSITLTLSPADSNATWQSSNTGYATVSGGTVSGVSAGTVVITVTSNNQTVTKDITVTAAGEVSCWHFTQNHCSKGNVTGTSCDTANNYYDSRETCESHISCGAGQGVTRTSDTNSACRQCEAGTYSSTSMNTCENCVNDTWSAAGATQCQTCPSNSVQSGHTKCLCSETGKTWDSGTNTCVTSLTCSVANCQTCVSGDSTKCQTCENYYHKTANDTCAADLAECCVNGTGYHTKPECEAHKNDTGYSTGICGNCDSLEHCTACHGSSTTMLCDSCDAGYHVESGRCVANGSCLSSGIYKDSTGSCKTCEKGYYCPENDNYRYECDLGSTTAGEGATDEDDCSICKDGYQKGNDGHCYETEQQVARLSCHTKVATGERQIIASCTNCTIQSGNGYTVENNGHQAIVTISDVTRDYTYSVTAVADSGKVFSGSSSCTAHILKSDTNEEIDLCCYKDGNTYKFGDVLATSCVTDSTIVHNEQLCLQKNKKECCYKVGNVYKFGETTAENCVNNDPDRQTCTARNKNCTATVTRDSQHTSRPEDSTDNSHYTVYVTLTGDGCLGQLVYDKASNAVRVTPSSFTAPDAGTYHYEVYPDDPCEPSNAWVILANGNRSNTTLDVDIKTDWKPQTICIKNPPVPFYTTYQSADAHGVDVYYSNYGLCADGVSTGYTIKWTRNDGCGGDPETPEKKCYVKKGNGTDNEYCYNYKEQCAGYDDVVSGRTEKTCSESPMCYLKSDGTYVKGKFYGQEGYTAIGSADCPKSEQPMCYVKYGTGSQDNTYCYNVKSKCSGYTDVIYGKDENSCGENAACYRRKSDGAYVTGKFDGRSDYQYYGKTCPKSEPACYKDPQGGYHWTNKPEESYIELTSIEKEEDCVTPSEDYHCYKDSQGKYHWTNTPDSSWQIQDGITKPEDCAPAESPACYKNTSTGIWSWGKYGKVIGWELVPSVTEEDKCVRPAPACYIDPHGSYVWGNYEDVKTYTLVSGITSQTDCRPESYIPVPPTALNTFNIVYIMLTVFSITGAVMIIYVKKGKALN